MKAFVLLAAVLPLAACQSDTSKIDQRLDKIEKLIAAQCGGGGRPGPAAQRPARPEPDRSKTYAVPVDNSFFEGPADAKITVVKATDYA
jgi:hypothetical protein